MFQSSQGADFVVLTPDILMKRKILRANSESGWVGPRYIVMYIFLERFIISEIYD